MTNLRLSGQYDERLLGPLGLQGPYYSWNRWYLPGVGRYLELDPLAVKGDINSGGSDAREHEDELPERRLDLRATAGLARLVKALRREMVALHASDQEATLELAAQPANVAQAIDDIVTAVRRLPTEVRGVWDACEMRRMDVGVAAGCAPHQMLFMVPLSTLLNMSAIGADLLFTVYGAEALGPARGSKVRKARRPGPAKRSSGRPRSKGSRRNT